MPNPNERRPARKPDPKAANARRGEKSRSAKGPAPARVAALEALMDVQISDAYAGLALTRRIASARLSALDRRLMTELFYGVLENRICLDYILSKYMERPCGDDVTLDILRMGVYQLVFMDKIPENAACNDAVELTRRFRREKMSGLVNAVLRGLVRDRSRIVYPEDPAEFLSVRYSFPRWLVDLLIDEYGMDFAKEMISFRDKQHDVTIRPNLLKMDAPAFEKYLTDQGFDWEKDAAPGVYRVRGGFVSQHPGFRQGLYSIMGESSYLAALAVGVKPGMQVLDACAAPGGKTCCMAEQMAGSGRVYAWDLHEHRVKLISGASQRLGLDNVRSARAGCKPSGGGYERAHGRRAGGRALFGFGGIFVQAGHQVSPSSGRADGTARIAAQDIGRLRAIRQAGRHAGLFYLHAFQGGK